MNKLPLLFFFAICTMLLGVKVYGNWCGPNHGSGKPIDALDRICMYHDKCYDKYGYFNCK